MADHKTRGNRAPRTSKHAGKPREIKLTPKRYARIMECIRRGFNKTQIAYYSGICYDTFYRWVRDGKEDREQGKDTLLARMIEDWTKIQAEQEHRLAASITRAALPYAEAVAAGVEDPVPDDADDRTRARREERPPDWKAAAYLLEQRHGWAGRKVSVDVEHSGQVDVGGDGGSRAAPRVEVVYDLSKCTPAQLRALAYPNETAIDDDDAIVIDVTARPTAGLLTDDGDEGSP